MKPEEDTTCFGGYSWSEMSHKTLHNCALTNAFPNNVPEYKRYIEQMPHETYRSNKSTSMACYQHEATVSIHFNWLL